MNLGWIGTGVMGGAMAGHLLANGHRLVVFSRTKAKAQPLLDRGAVWAESPRAVAERSDVVFTMVGFPHEVREVYFGQNGLLSSPVGRASPRGRDTSPARGDARATERRIFVDMTTTSPTLAREIAAQATALDAPVSGGDVGARKATLSIMVGGDRAAFERVVPLLECLGKTIVYQGPAGAGQHAKLANQIVIAGTMIGVCEALVYGKAAGLDLETMLRSIRPGAAGCWTLEHLAPRILAGNFDPGFYAEHFLKDLGLALEECRRRQLNLRGLALAEELYRRAVELGHGQKGTHALFLALQS